MALRAWKVSRAFEKRGPVVISYLGPAVTQAVTDCTFLICYFPSYILFIFVFVLLILHQTLISVIMLIPDASSFSSLVDFFSFAAWLFYGGTFASLLWLRYKKPNLNRPYKVSCLSKCTKNTMQFVNAPQVIRENWSVCLRQNSDWKEQFSKKYWSNLHSNN